MKRLLRWIVIIAVLAGGGYFYFKRDAGEGDKKASRFESYKVTRGDIKLSAQSTATVRPQNRLEIKPPVAGRIEEVLVNEGDAVTAGQVIATMSSSDRAAVLDAARARGVEALAKWSDIYKVTPVVAPLAGTIIARNIEPGQTLTAQDILFVMSDVLIVEALVDETDLGAIKVGQACEVVIDAYPGRAFPARVSQIAYEAQTVQNVTVYAVDVLPERAPEFMRSGMTANVTFMSQQALGVLMIPAEAVQNERGRKTVWIGSPDNPDSKSAKDVTTGISDGRMTEVSEGLAEGEEILVPQIISGTLDQSKTSPFVPWRRPSGGMGSRR